MEKVRNGVTTRDGKGEREIGQKAREKEKENGLCCTLMAVTPRDTKGNLILVIRQAARSRAFALHGRIVPFSAEHHRRSENQCSIVVDAG